MRITRNIPNVITCLNLLCGCAGIVFAMRNNSQWQVVPALLISLAAVFDFLDGLVARLLNAHSEIGKQLDSLADMVSFGLLPGCILFQMINADFAGLQEDSMHLAYVALLIPVFSALRLAKFNTDLRQTDSFIGLPTPANSLLVASFPLILFSKMSFFDTQPPLLTHTILNPWFLIALVPVLCYLLVAELPLFALKFKNFSWINNRIRYVFLGLSLTLLCIFHFSAIPLIILIYILLSVLNKQMS